jgi:hypothetical protein
LRACLWPHDTFVDFEHSLNPAIKRLQRTSPTDSRETGRRYAGSPAPPLQRSSPSRLSVSEYLAFLAQVVVPG